MKTWSRRVSPGPLLAVLATVSVLVAGVAAPASSSAGDSGSWSATTYSPVSNRYWHTATPLPGGRVLMAGGHFPESFIATYRTEIYDPGTDRWAAATRMHVPRERHTATLLQEPGCGLLCGMVLVTGGAEEVDSPFTTSAGPALGSAELYDPSTNQWVPTAPLTDLRANHSATLLPDGTVLVAGGLAARVEGQAAVATDSAEIYDPATGLFVPTDGLMTRARGDHTATLLPNGRVLIAGRIQGPADPTGSSTEIYDPTSRTFRATGGLAVGRSRHTATLLPGGKVLVTGGIGAGSSAELYDPATGTWNRIADMSVDRVDHTATLLSSGEVLVAGGSDGTSAEIFNPATEQWRVTGTLTTPRRDHTATVLPSGKVLATGGSCSLFSQQHSSCPWAEIYTTTPRSAPDAPTGVRATAGNASASVSWTAPASDGGSPIAGYTVTSSPDGITASVDGSSTSATVNGLTNGASYTFTVRATNAVGTGAASEPSNAVTPMGVPEAPTDVTATAGDASASVSWTAPSRDGGSPITGYTVTSSPDGITASVGGSSTSATVTGLTNGVTYTFTVTATNAVGTGAASEPSNAVTPTKKKKK